jgi:hypothetical protein
MRKIKLGVSGTRQFNDYDFIKKQLLKYFNPKNIECIISGGAVGVDKCCEIFAREYEIPISLHRPDYDTYGKSAPFIRNKDIVFECDGLIAFPLGNGDSHGTEHTIAEAKRMNKPVKIIKVYKGV